MRTTCTSLIGLAASAKRQAGSSLRITQGSMSNSRMSIAHPPGFFMVHACSDTGWIVRSSAAKVSSNSPLLPAKPETQGRQTDSFRQVALDSRLRGNDRMRASRCDTAWEELFFDDPGGIHYWRLPAG